MVGSVFNDLSALIGAWYAAKALHEHMLQAIMRVPLIFFDTTPLGRIIARFSKDIDVMDTGLPFQISSGIYCLFEVVLLALTSLTILKHLEVICIPILLDSILGHGILRCVGFRILEESIEIIILLRNR